MHIYIRLKRWLSNAQTDRPYDRPTDRPSAAPPSHSVEALALALQCSHLLLSAYLLAYLHTTLFVPPSSLVSFAHPFVCCATAALYWAGFVSLAGCRMEKCVSCSMTNVATVASASFYMRLCRCTCVSAYVCVSTFEWATICLQRCRSLSTCRTHKLSIYRRRFSFVLCLCIFITAQVTV